MLLLSIVSTRLALPPNPVVFILVFFAYSLAGYIMECIVLTVDNRQLTTDRGFTNHLPFCIIYGFGGMLGYALLSPLNDNPVLLFIVGAMVATLFEMFTAQLQVRLFGDFWWDYNEKPFNYKGMLCLESTFGWGIVALLIVKVIHKNIVGLVMEIPFILAAPLAVILLTAYAFDFIQSAREAKAKEDYDLQFQELHTEEYNR